ncbi:hypothetical protein FHS72_001800 [Loktanella ponticola]|uniref:Sulfotransferase n=1 Tax=Yoonia ponticola TaxID=1524255 RepID=A0A7W9BKT4_9RHOB|nr:sulfotransferase [Yoonia ponticola]MBB5722176.1 hypothetical protein [Yoonia ponticola]
MMDGQTLMYGLGATKAGTSWLYRYLYDHPECALPNIKELHYFDRTVPKQREKEVLRLETIRAELLAKSLLADKRKAERLESRLDEIEAWIKVIKAGGVDHTGYRDFLTRDAFSDTRLVADITPAYGLMDEETLIKMRDMGPDTRFVLLLRDPLDRLWSNLRMMAGWRVKDGETLTDAANTLLDRLLAGEENGVAKRSDYETMLTRIMNVIPHERLHITYFEDLFTQESVDKICTFLGLSPQVGEFDRVVHASRPATLDPVRAKDLRELLLPQYAFVETLLDDVPARWHHNKGVLI